MSVYWFAMCEKHKEFCDAGSSHTSGNFHFTDELGAFIGKHPGCSLRFVPDPDEDSCPEFYECEEFKP